ncbi:hypothetical protein ACOMHN_039161 [Nucella lapillus]
MTPLLRDTSFNYCGFKANKAQWSIDRTGSAVHWTEAVTGAEPLAGWSFEQTTGLTAHCSVAMKMKGHNQEMKDEAEVPCVLFISFLHADWLTFWVASCCWCCQLAGCWAGEQRQGCAGLEKGGGEKWSENEYVRASMGSQF